MDLAEYFKKKFANLHKDAFDKNYKKKSLTRRKESLINARRITRDTVLFNHRKIDINMSPMTPAVPKKIEPKVPKPNKRLEILKQWKEKKNRLKQEEQERKRNKPAFKVFHVHQSLYPNLENVNKEIKGKLIKPLSTPLKSFAPATHKFVAPKNVRPIKLTSALNTKRNGSSSNTTQSIPKINAKKNLNTASKSNVNINNVNTKKIVPSGGAKIVKVISTSNLRKAASNTNLRKDLQKATTNQIPITTNVKKAPSNTDLRKDIQNATSTQTSVTSNMKKVPSRTNIKKTGSIVSSSYNLRKDFRSAYVKETSSTINLKTRNNIKRVPSHADLNKRIGMSPKSNKAVGFNGTSNSDFEEKKPGKTYKKTPRKIKGNSVDLDKSFDSKTPVKKKSQDFKTPESQLIPPMKKRKSFETEPVIEKEATSFMKENEIKNHSVILISDDSVDNKNGTVIYEDEEVTMKTPIKNTPRRSTRITPKYTPRPASTRKSIKRRDSCVLCPDSPAANDENKSEKKVKTPRSKNRRSKKNTKSAEEVDISILNSRTPDKNSNGQIEENSETTPDNRNSSVYISPFVTISRGKESARKEFKIRKSNGGIFAKSLNGIDFSVATSPTAGAEYFEGKLNNEIERLEAMCDYWIKYKEETNQQEETVDMINVTIGQSRLLITKKFKQFRDLINQCRLNIFTENKITCEDLHGFWDMIYQAVENINTRFENLERLKENNWEEVLPEKKVILPQKKVVPVRGRGRPKKSVAKSSLKDIIKAGRNKKQEIEIEIMEPKTSAYMKRPSIISMNSARRSKSLNSATMNRYSSPGLTIMKITQAIKAGNGLTPSKSILKTDLSKSEKRSAKSVLFVENVDTSISRKTLFSPEDKENRPKEANFNENMQIVLESPHSLRRSRRIGKTT